MAKYEAKFYDTETGELFFYLRKDSSDKMGVPFEFDGPAEPKHKRDYAIEHDRYLESRAMENLESEETEPEVFDDSDVIKASIPLGK